ncbi:MAG: helix-turn-helix domain-containing protein [Clostridiales bacterium]|nr:helix-turn-helix domain-containing protein [Clostridiales bacterium]
MAVNFGVQLRHMRKMRRYTQKQLAQLVGVPVSCITAMENNKRKPDAYTLAKLSQVLEVSADYLLCVESYKDKKEEKHKEKNESNVKLPEKNALPLFGDSTEALDVINSITNALQEQAGLMYNGEPIGEEDLQKVADAIRIAGEIALRQCKRKE